jgi:hypothetical protein
MPPFIPRYIELSNVAAQTMRYKWDDWNIEQAEEPIDESLAGRFSQLSLRAVVAFTLGTAEWIVYRYKTLCDISLPLQYLEASWVRIVDFRYGSVTWEEFVNESEWSGPVKGPIGTAMTRVMYAISEAEEYGNPELRACWIFNLARYVLADPGPYDTWGEQVLLRLNSIYQRNSNEMLGEVIPREAIDPAFHFNLAQTEELINQFLAGLDHRSNPFLCSPEKMFEDGYKGTPYVFDIERERENRVEW